YFDHESELKKIPNLDISGATLSRVDAVVNFDHDTWNIPFYPLETWATCWRVYLKVLVEARYTFVVGSDDGALLEIDNKQICGQDRLQGYFESKAEVDLPKGLHVLKLRFFNNRGPGACKLFWIPPGKEQAIVPQDVLYPAGGTAEVGRPSITGVGPDFAKRGEKIKITGANFADIPSLNKVTFGPTNIPGFVEEASATELVVVVPNGVDQGPVSIKVGDLTAPAVPYNVGGFFGLYMRAWSDASAKEAVASYADPTTNVPPDDEQLVGPVNARNIAAFKLPFAATNFRACYVGRFWAQDAGQHGFALESDDGSRLLLDGQLVVDNGGSHGRKRVEGAIFLAAGWHDIEIDYFQGVSEGNLTLLHADPDQKLAVCLRGLLAPPLEMDTRVVPAITGLNPNPAKAGDRLLIAGAGLVGPDGRNPAVTLGGKALPVVAASPGSIAVEIPFGFDSGPLVVRAGPLATAPFDLTVTGYGIKAEYWQFDQAITVMPPFDTAPKLTRVEDRVDYQEDVAFKFPWSREHFAARWSGKLWVPADGSYELATGSDDGSRLTIDHQLAVDNDGLHGYVEKGTQLQLTAGVHTLVLEFFENEGEARCRLLWKPPGVKNRVVIPRSNLVPAD
ncbi:MAG: PA14 domain-containing protein, partial [Planctomycetota bacterium]